MGRKTNGALVVFLIVSTWMLVGCKSNAPARGTAWNATKGTETEIRKDSDYTKGRFRTILVLGITGSKTIRANLENRFVTLLKARGVGAAPSYQVLPPDQQIDRELIERYIVDTGIDGVLVTQLKASGTEVSKPIKTNRQTPPPEPMEHQFGTRDFYGYYSLTYAAVRETDFPMENSFFELETKLFEVKETKEVWSLRRKSTNPTSANALIKELCTVVVEALASENLI